MEYVYTVWFKDTSALPEDQDHEWPACILIEAATESDAKSWGDHLARRYCKKCPNEMFLRSEIRSRDDEFYKSVSNWHSTPLVQYGEEASDEKIGW